MNMLDALRQVYHHGGSCRPLGWVGRAIAYATVHAYGRYPFLHHIPLGGFSYSPLKDFPSIIECLGEWEVVDTTQVWEEAEKERETNR